MGLFGKIKELAGIEDIDEEEDEIEEAPAKIERPLSAPLPVRPMPQAEPVQRPAASSSRYNTTAPIKMVVIEPQSFDESPRLVDSLKAKKPVIINLENLETDSARKIFDFLSGATYALNGNVRKVANNIFVFAPENVEVTMNQKPSEVAEKSPWK